MTLAQLKEELVPLIGVPPTGFIVYEIRYGVEYEIEELDGTLLNINSGSKVYSLACYLIHFFFPLYIYIIHIYATKIMSDEC